MENKLFSRSHFFPFPVSTGFRRLCGIRERKNFFSDALAVDAAMSRLEPCRAEWMSASSERPVSRRRRRLDDSTSLIRLSQNRRGFFFARDRLT